MKLEELERRLRNDLTHEAMIWGSRVLLHREIPAQTGTACAGTRAGTPSRGVSPSRSPSLQYTTPGKRRAVEREAEGDLQPQMSDDVTKKEDDSAEPQHLMAFWESTGVGLASTYCQWPDSRACTFGQGIFEASCPEKRLVQGYQSWQWIEEQAMALVALRPAIGRPLC